MAHKVLILDDDLNAGRLMVQALAPLSIEAEAHQSVKAALAAFKVARPHLVILDVLLPEADGFKVAEELRKGSPDLPIVFVSAVYKKPQVARDVQARFGAPLVVKPFDLSVLRRAVADGLRMPYEPPPSFTPGPGADARLTPGPQAAIGTMAGDLARKPLYALLGELYRGRATGVLELTREPLRKRVYLDRGFVRFATSNVRAESVAGLLLSEGRLTEAQAAVALETARNRQIQLHDALVAVGAISPAQLQPLLQRQTSEVVVAGCGLPDGSYAFQPLGELSVPDARQHPLALALHGVQRFYPLPAIRDYLQARAGLALHRSPHLEREDYTIKKVFPGEKVTALVNGRTMVLEAIEKLPEAELPLLFGLIGVGLVGFQPFPPAMSRSGPGPVARTPAAGHPASLDRTPVLTPVRPVDGVRPPVNGAAVPSSGVLVQGMGTASTLPPPDPADFTPVDPATDSVRAAILAEYRRVAALDHYALLGVERKAPPGEIKRAYIEAARKWHADSFAGVNLGKADAYLQAIFSAVGEAHRVLTDAGARAEYDVYLDRRARGLPTDVGAILAAEELFGKAENLFRSERFAEAESLLRRALELNHAEAEFWAYLGACAFRLRGIGGAAEARSCFARARELIPGLPVIELFTAQLEILEGSLDTADDRLSRILLEKPDHREARAQLRSLRERREKEAGSGGLLGKFLNRK